MKIASCLALAVLLALSSEAGAQAACKSGRTLQGTCANPGLDRLMRQTTIIGTQPKISTTAPLNLPSEDRQWGPFRTVQRYETLWLFNPSSGRNVGGGFIPPSAIGQP